MLRVQRTEVAARELLSQLADELLDAHVDTMTLAADMDDVPGWATHLDYLRGLQRVGREALALLDDSGH